MFTCNSDKIFFFNVILNLVQLKQELVGFLALLHVSCFFVLLSCFFLFNITFFRFLFDWFVWFSLGLVDCAFYSWKILIVPVFCNEICWFIMVDVNFMVLYFYSSKILIVPVFCNEICWFIMVSANFMVLYLRFLFS